MIFGIKEKSIILTHTVSVLLSTATNITVRLMTGFVVQSHVLFNFYDIFSFYLHISAGNQLPYITEQGLNSEFELHSIMNVRKYN